MSRILRSRRTSTDVSCSAAQARNIIRRVFALGLLALASSSAAAPPLAVADTLATVKARGELVWGGDMQGGEPYVFEDPKDHHLIGFEVDIADGLAQRLGVKARFAQADWSNLVPGLERGDFDVAMNGLEDTPARRGRILLSLPYFLFGETLAIRRGAKKRSLEDLRGARVGTLNQSYAYDLLRERGFDPALYEGAYEPYTDLELGRVDGVLLDHVIADRYGCNRPALECVPGDVARGTNVIGIRRGDERLKSALDVAISDLQKSGGLEKILTRWKLWDERQASLVPKDAAPLSSASAAPSASAEPSRDESPSDVAPSPRTWSMEDTKLFLSGAGVTIGLSLTAFLLALPIGLLLALARLEKARVPRFVATAYVELFRGTPLLLQLYVLYFALAPIVRLGAVPAAVLGLSLNYAAYEAEIHRGALLAVPRGQSEAARALGLGRWQTLWHVLLPQSFRIALPSMTNDFVALLKDSSLVSVITVVELTKRMTITAVDLRGWFVPGFACAALYFMMSYPLARLAQYMEARLRHDQHSEAA
jgi:polar amino acid transport system substrate-binding protein